MIRTSFRVTVASLSLSLASLAFVGCGDSSDSKSDSAPKAKAVDPSTLLGVYENTNDKMTLELKPDGVAVMTDEGSPSTLKWETDGASKIVMHGTEGVSLTFNINSEGNLSAENLSTVFRKKK